MRLDLERKAWARPVGASQFSLLLRLAVPLPGRCPRQTLDLPPMAFRRSRNFRRHRQILSLATVRPPLYQFRPWVFL